MPKIVYGIMTFHRSHKIESPNPDFEFSQDKPNACIACHEDKSSAWVIEQSNHIWPALKSENHTVVNETIQSIYKLHSGDPVERAIAANNLSNKNKENYSQGKIFLIPHLLFAMEDTYPAIRRFSYKSLNSILENLSIESSEFTSLKRSIKDFDFIADENLRTNILIKAWKEFSIWINQIG